MIPNFLLVGIISGKEDKKENWKLVKVRIDNYFFKSTGFVFCSVWPLISAVTIEKVCSAHVRYIEPRVPKMGIMSEVISVFIPYPIKYMLSCHVVCKTKLGLLLLLRAAEPILFLCLRKISTSFNRDSGSSIYQSLFPLGWFNYLWNSNSLLFPEDCVTNRALLW